MLLRSPKHITDSMCVQSVRQSVGAMNWGSALSAAQLSHEPYGLAYCLVETRKSLTVDECLAEVFASVDLPNSNDR